MSKPALRLVARTRPKLVRDPLAKSGPFVRATPACHASEAMHAASALGPDIAAPLVPVNSAEARIAVIVSWLASPEFSPEEKDAMVWAWRLKDFTTVSEMADSPDVPVAVRLLLKS